MRTVPLTAIIISAALAVTGCGGGGSNSDDMLVAEPLKGADLNKNGIRDSIEQSIDSSFGSDANQLKLAKALSVQAEGLLATNVPTPEAARTALEASSRLVQCASTSMTRTAIDGVKMEVWRLTFNTLERRQRLKEVFANAGVFSLEISTGDMPC